jgi:hypothetical protein
MATFIPDRVGSSGARSIRIKDTLKALDDAYVVRTPVKRNEWTPDFFVQHPVEGWLAIVVSETPASVLAAGHLFENDARADFENMLTSFQGCTVAPAGDEPLGKLVLMWACSPEEVQPVAGQYLVRFGIRLLSRKQFQDVGAKLVARLLTPIGLEAEQAILQRYFPETEIHASCTTRRKLARDNSAQLQRFFLDHQQEWAAKLDLDLEQPADQKELARDFSTRLVNGVAGSGKTLIALARAQLLAELHPEQRILVLIHNTPVVADVRAKLIRTRGGIPANLEINNFSAWAHRQWRNTHKGFLNLPNRVDEVEDLIRHYLEQSPELRQPIALLREEFDFINESLITEAEQYFKASRAGRGFALRSTERPAVWTLFRKVTKAMHGSGKKMWSTVPLEICLSADRERLDLYDHVLIDEAQFFAPSWFQAVRLALRPGGSLFMCADPNQGFMKQRLSWKGVGIDVTGRTKRLRKSYRTTQAILASASAFLAQHAQGDPDDFLVPDLAGMEAGVEPMLIRTDSPQDSVDRLVNELETNISENVFGLGDVLVIYGEKVQKQLLYERLKQRFGDNSVWWLNKDRKEPPDGYKHDYLRIANLETATGLEAHIVFLIGVEDLLSGHLSIDHEGDDPATVREARARKLYMAMTRAGHYLVVLSSQRLPAHAEEAFRELRQEQATP